MLVGRALESAVFEQSGCISLYSIFLTSLFGLFVIGRDGDSWPQAEAKDAPDVVMERGSY